MGEGVPASVWVGRRVICANLSLRLPSTANLREHWATRARRAKSHRAAGRFAVSRLVECPPLPVTVTLVRVSPRRLDDDNLAAAFKAFRDGVADGLGVDDRDARIAWRYAQERGPVAVRLEVERGLR